MGQKESQLQYGYQCHDLAAADTGLVLAVHTTAARVHDGQGMASCLDRVALPLQYGYQCHDLAAADTGLVLAVHTTAARVHDGQGMASCLDRVALP
jgi:IS5 family transposase